MLDGTLESRSTAVIRRTAELLASEAPLRDRFPRFARELAALFGASRVKLAIGARPEETLLWTDGTAPGLDDPAEFEDARRGSVVASTRAIAVPLAYDGTIAGALGIAAAADTAYEDEDVDTLRACAIYLAVRVHEESVRADRDRLAELAGTDALTGILNRRAFDERLEAEWRRAMREQTSLAAAMIDIDRFKSFNDRYGHVAGDLCLKRVSRALAEALHRPGDLVARIGGEEFCAILPATGESGAVALAEALRAAVAAEAIPHEGTAAGVVTVSCGVAALEPRDGDPTALIELADAALYAAKAAGRDQVATGTPAP